VDKKITQGTFEVGTFACTRGMAPLLNKKTKIKRYRYCDQATDAFKLTVDLYRIDMSFLISGTRIGHFHFHNWVSFMDGKHCHSESMELITTSAQVIVSKGTKKGQESY
jgi:hypothetical protein